MPPVHSFKSAVHKQEEYYVIIDSGKIDKSFKRQKCSHKSEIVHCMPDLLSIRLSVIVVNFYKLHIACVLHPVLHG